MRAPGGARTRVMGEGRSPATQAASAPDTHGTASCARRPSWRSSSVPQCRGTRHWRASCTHADTRSWRSPWRASPACCCAASTAQALTAQEKVGRSLFFDAALSEPAGQACAACHAGNVGWTGPDASINGAGAVYEGAIPATVRQPQAARGRVCRRQPDPSLRRTTADWVGGMFWDGRASGCHAGRSAGRAGSGTVPQPARAEQRQRPRRSSARSQASKLRAACSRRSGVRGMHCAASTTRCLRGASPAPSQRTRARRRSAAFTSKYDAYLAGRAPLTAQEKPTGLTLFEGKANCSGCHISEPRPTGAPPLFTDFTYDNLGMPKNPLNPFYTMQPWINPAGSRLGRHRARRVPREGAGLRARTSTSRSSAS